MTVNQILIFMIILGFVLISSVRCTEDGCPHKKFFHTRFLMRMRLTPDCSKMLISTSSGYLLILHDLDLTKSLEVGSYPILRARRTTSSSGKLLLFDFRKFSIEFHTKGWYMFPFWEWYQEGGKEIWRHFWKAHWKLFFPRKYDLYEFLT